ncbi:GDP-fucose protein O-fucosyltransferase 1-like [Orbicella faveolata]|uniref:GDP-fucose protein O-fucosyltransferase 1-like n=1 Tax=Orbicella faveolata TaxID=48498 RepID=UPI0009E3C458|nr:GDP-fucose protein O-fucosyltransferase 1-like [Orbicella faveolata]
MFAKKNLTFFCPWISLFISLLAISPRCHAEDHLGEDLDEKIAFVAGQQQPMSFAPASANHSTGYIVYCPCMGRFGNQADQFLGSLAFAKGLKRTLILPPWIVYPSHKIGGSDRVPFDDWFLVKPLEAYHNVITMETFMKDIAPRVWPPGQRIGFCYSFRDNQRCGMKDGNPFGPFWDHFHINFDDYREHSGLLWNTDQDWARDGWDTRFPVSEYPVIALMGAPGSFPVHEKDRWLQKFVQWSVKIEKKAKEFLTSILQNEPFVGIHLRNGIDFERACEHVKDPHTTSFFASPQCIQPGSNKKLTYEMCFPPKSEILKKTKKIVKKAKAKRVFVATDNDPMIKELSNALKSLKVSVHRRDPSDEISDPIVELAVLTMADHFIGNCVSSFTSFVTRYRAVNDKPTSFWAFKDEK